MPAATSARQCVPGSMRPRWAKVQITPMLSMPRIIRFFADRGKQRRVALQIVRLDSIAACLLVDLAGAARPQAGGQPGLSQSGSQ
jgi:hypothetical protein